MAGVAVGVMPGLNWLAAQDYAFWRNVTPWFGRVVLRLHEPVLFTYSGSGDKLFDWVQMAGVLSLALVLAAIWMWFDRRRRWDPLARDLMRIVLRYGLGTVMLSYGMSKLLHQQMPAPHLFRLVEPYGESSPMGLLWTFMGQSAAYSAFAGGLEFLGGFLLFFRRTVILGALILVVVLTNVLLMNLCFDVPVKLYSALYLFMALVLVAPEAGRLWSLLVLRRAVAPSLASEVRRAWPAGRAGRLLTVVKALVVLQILWVVPAQAYFRWRDHSPAKPELYGLYEVETFTQNGETHPPLLTDRARWRRVMIDEGNFFVVQFMDDHRRFFRIRNTSQPGKLVVEPNSGPKRGESISFTIAHPAERELLLEGRLDEAALAVRLRRADDAKLLLQNRGFHWINEQPFNR
ncbi:MAG TPA: hypothetical protein VG710_08140 [Opitutus sp.]|nr:hypothetical protein [Opitutus sp.]